MKYVLGSALLLFFLTKSAIADDEARNYSTSFDWSGGYGGVYAGWYGVDISAKDIEELIYPPFQLEDIDASDLAVGVLAGWNWQSGKIVFGIEADIGVGGSGSSFIDPENFDETLEWKNNLSGSLRGRVGLAHGNWLFYGTGGVALTNATYGYLNLENSLDVVDEDERFSNTFTGFAVGLGVDWAMTEKTFVRFEYMHYEFGSITQELVPDIAPIEYSPSMDTLRAAVVLKF